MGMTPLDGLVMGTRSGDLDAAIVSYISTKEGLSVAQTEALLNTQSGLLGLSGLTDDMRVLQKELTLHEDHRVRAAIDVFCYRVRKYIGAFLAGMAGAEGGIAAEGSALLGYLIPTDEELLIARDTVEAVSAEANRMKFVALLWCEDPGVKNLGAA
jgi:acetate kinase